MSKICKRCEKYNVVLIADKTQPSKYMKVAPQSESEEEHWTAIKRWVFVFPLEETDYCYYCTKIMNGQISKPVTYGYAYEAKQTPVWSIGSSDNSPRKNHVAAIQAAPILEPDDVRTFNDDWERNRPRHSHL